MSHILILAALAEEADAVFSNHGDRDLPHQDITKLGFSGRRLSVAGHDICIVETGLGKVNAALAAGLFGSEADIVLMTGTCGALAADAGAYWITDAVQHDYGAAESSGFVRYRAGTWPMGEAGPLSFAAMADPLGVLPLARIASGDSFVADAKAAAEMRDALTVQLVDMEVAAVAQAAARMGKPWAAIKAVTDDANGDSGGDFHSNLLRAAHQAGAAIEALVAAL